MATNAIYLSDLTNKRIGDFIVLERVSAYKGRLTEWRCACELCHRESTKTSYYLLRSRYKQLCKICCRQKQFPKKTIPFYSRWKGMHRRCGNPTSRDYYLYGGRGITVCDEWNDFHNFQMWCQKTNPTAETSLQIDRIDNNKGYSPDNCHWVTCKQNNNNRRSSHIVTLGGYSGSLVNMARQCGMASTETISTRLRDGWNEIDAFLKPSPSMKKAVETAFGLHIFLDIYLGNYESLSNIEHIKQFLLSAPDRIGMTRIIDPLVFSYSGKVEEDWGVTGMVVLAESHISIHTFPDRNGFATLDAYSCRCFDPAVFVKYVQKYFEPKKFSCSGYIRGLDFVRHQIKDKAKSLHLEESTR